jgi:hypothetical protein
VKVIKKQRNGANAKLHEKLIALFLRPSGATLADTIEAGYAYPAVQALKLAERRGLKTSVKKAAGEPTRYIARRA